MELDARRTGIDPGVRLESGPHGTHCPSQVRPFNPSLVAGTSNPDAGAFSSFSLKLDREDGDQFLGKLNFTMPPGLTGNLTGHRLLPRSGDRRRRADGGPHREGAAELPGELSEIGTSNVAAGPAATRSMPSAGSTWRARSKARR